jgi:hypothetical protein
MTDTAVDGDISDFFDTQAGLAGEFRRDALLAYLLNAGHADTDARAAVLRWQEYRFKRVNGTWEKFGLTPAGLVAVTRLRAHPASPARSEAGPRSA